MLIDRLREVTQKARLYVRVAQHSGMLRELRPAGVLALAKAATRNMNGPSAIFRIQGANSPSTVAMVFEGRSLTYGEIDQRIDRLAHGLRRHGFGKGETAAVMLHNVPELLEIAPALSRIGASSVSVSWRSTANELRYLLENSGAGLLLFDSSLASTVKAAVGASGRPRLIAIGPRVDGTASYDDIVEQPAIAMRDEDEGAVIIYTSGTTGRPKGAVRRFGRGQMDGFFAFIAETPIQVRDRHLCVCPLYHSTGIGFAGMTLMLGGTVYIEREFDPERFLQIIEREAITTTAVVPTMLHRLMALPENVLNKYRTDSLRALFVGGAQLPGPLGTKTLERFGPVLYNFYGATETGLVALAGPDDLRASPGTIGNVLPGTEVRLLDEAGNQVREGEVGELYARNAMLVGGYHADPESTRASMRDGFFSVGDLARVDAVGRYHVVGRRRDMVISGGVNVYPVEVEAVIEAHRDVAQVAVVGVPDEEWGERVRAFVVRRAGRTVEAAELREFCRQTLSGAKVPREWVFVDSLPSNPTGKVLKRELRDWKGDVVRVG